MQTAVIYTRVSTEEQKNTGFSLQDQERRLREACNRNGYEILEHYEEDSSAKTFKRPEFQRFLNDFKSKRVRPNIFMAVRIDRFSRNAMATYQMYMQFLEWNITLEFLEDNLRLKSPEDLLLFWIKASLPEVDNRRRADNTKRGLRQGLREGRWMGRAPIGYKNNTQTRLVEIDTAIAEHIRFAFEKFGSGLYSAEQVRMMLFDKGIKLCKQAFLNLLNNPFYTGNILIPEWENEPAQIIKGLHDPIISDDLFREVKQILSQKRKPYKGITRKNDLILINHLICPICGRMMTGSTSKGNGGHYSYYHCQAKYGCKNRFNANLANIEFTNYLRSFEISEEVKKLYYAILSDVFKNSEKDKEDEKRKLEREIKEVQFRITSVENKLIDNIIDTDTYLKIKKRLSETENDLIMKHLTFSKVSTDFKKYTEFGLTLINNLSSFFSNAQPEIKKKMIGSIFPQNLIFENKSYRTSKMNEFFELICKPDNDSKKKQPHKEVKLSSLAPKAGLEPATL